MAYINDEVYDQGLNYATLYGVRLDICSSEPANYAGIAAVSLGHKDPVVTGAAENGLIDGRKVVVPEITDGIVTGNGDATHWALFDDINNILVATDTLNNGPQTVTSGNPFTLDAVNVKLRDATTV